MAQARSKPKLRTLDDAAAALGRLGEVERTLEIHKLELKAELQHIASEAENADAELVEERDGLQAQLLAFADAHRDLLVGNKRVGVRQLPTGRLGWERGTAVVQLPEDPKELDRLVVHLRNYAPQFLRTKAEPDKQALKKDPEAAARIPGVRILQEPRFVCAPLKGEVR